MLAAAAVVAALVALRGILPRIVERRLGARQERDGDGVVVGAAPIERSRDGTPAILLLHGGGDTPQVMAGLADHLYARGYSVRVPLLSGHGRSIRDFSHVAAEQWHREVAAEYEMLRVRHGRVGVVGLSMGGALAVTLAARRKDVPALVLLSPYIAMAPALRRVARASRVWGPLLPYFGSRGGRSIHDPAAAGRGLGYGVFTPDALRALADAVRDGEAALPDVRAPTLMVQSREDNRIPQKSAERIFARLGAPTKRLEWLENTGHVITVDYGHQLVFDLTSTWLQSHLPAEP